MSASRLTAAKEGGESIVIDGKKVALGIPGGGRRGLDTTQPLPGIPLGRPGAPDAAVGLSDKVQPGLAMIVAIRVSFPS